MNILLIGNFAPPYEEESLHNISLYQRLIDDGHRCTVINISPVPAVKGQFINASGNAGYFLTLLRHGSNKDVIHFLTKGYLRVGLLKMMLSIFVGTIMRAKKIITFHSEFFSVLGQMRSPFGGTQTLNTSFFLADTIIFTDQESMDAAALYRKKDNYALVPSFLSFDNRDDDHVSSPPAGLKAVKKLAFFGNVKQPSFLLDVLTEFIQNGKIPDDGGIAVAFAEKPSDELEQRLTDAAGPLRDRLLFIENDDMTSSLQCIARAPVLVNPMTCDGEPFFEEFAVTLKNTMKSGNTILVPGTVVAVKGGSSTHFITSMLTRAFSEDLSSTTEIEEDPYQMILGIYTR